MCFLFDWLFGDDKPEKEVSDKVVGYKLKESLLSECEQYFYKVLKKGFSDKYDIIPQVPLSGIIDKEKDFDTQFQNELYRVIDFGIFDKNTLKPLLLIEINDNTHNQKNRQARDIKVKNICSSANIKLITFYTQYSNKEDYIIDRVKKELENNSSSR